MTPELQQTQDMLNAIGNQRNAALNECVQLAAQLMAAQREVAGLKERIAEMEGKAKAEPQPNGAAAQA